MIILILPFIIGFLSIFSYYIGYNKISNMLTGYIGLLYIVTFDNFLMGLTTKNSYILLLGN